MTTTHRDPTRLALLRSAALLAAVLLTAAGCQRAAPALDGHYRATLQLPGGELPFGLDIETQQGKPRAYLLNGSERLEIPEVTLAQSKLTLLMPGLQNRIDAEVRADALRGELRLVRRGGEIQVIPFAAERGKSYRFFAATPSSGAAVEPGVAGRWAVDFIDSDGEHSPAVGEFTQTGGSVTGTFLTPTGDHRFLAGDLRGRELFLSKFDGAQAYLYHATLEDGGKLTGEQWSGLKGHDRIVAQRDDNASLGDSEQATKLRDGGKRLDFSFPDLDGKTVTFQDERFKGKVVVVTLAGSWCPNCHDEAGFLAPYYKAHRAQGLEVASLMFEYYDQYPAAVEAVRRFREKFDIQYTLLVAGINDKADSSLKLPQLERVIAYPTTFFIDRKGQVRRIHTGFSGPATGEHYVQLKQDFESTLATLLAEAS